MDLAQCCCRLCAQSKLIENQLDLQANVDRRHEINEKLTRINATVAFNVDLLPNTVCFKCIQALNKAYEFVVAVECAQKELIMLTAEPAINIENYEVLSPVLIECMSMYELEDIEVEVASEPNCDIEFCSKTGSDGDDSSQESDHESYHISQESNCVSQESNCVSQEFDCISQESNCVSQDFDNVSQESNRVSQKSGNISKNSKRSITQSLPKNLSKQKCKPAVPSNLKTWIDYKWYCTVCETLFEAIDELQKHSKAAHKICNPYRCTDCNYRSAKLDKFVLHVQKHHEQLKLSCYKCFKQFTNVAALKKHKLTHISNSFVCIGCKISFMTNVELQNHIKYFQMKRSRNIPLELIDGTTCKLCQKKFRTKNLVRSHVLTHIGRKECVCEVCGKGFSRKGHLEAHMVTHSDERAFKCNICNSTFKRHDSLLNHASLHNTEKTFKCSECNRSFRLRSQLKSHQIVHTDLYPYECPICPKRFRFKGKLTDHARVHSGDKPYSCTICPRDFCGWSNYNKHMRNMHNMDIAKKKRARRTALKPTLKPACLKSKSKKT